MIFFSANLILRLASLMIYLLKSLFYLLIKGSLKIQHDFCPSSGSNSIRKNGTTHNSKAKNECKNCGRQFVIKNTKKIVTQAQKDLIDKLLLERISWRGITRVVDVSWRWLQNYINNKFAQVPRKIKVSDKPRGKLIIECPKGYRSAYDELWSFVDTKDNKYWVWLAIAKRESAQKLWKSIRACLSTMCYRLY